MKCSPDIVKIMLFLFRFGWNPQNSLWNKSGVSELKYELKFLSLKIYLCVDDVFSCFSGPANALFRLSVKFFPPDPGQLHEEYTRSVTVISYWILHLSRACVERLDKLNRFLFLFRTSQLWFLGHNSICLPKNVFEILSLPSFNH